MIKLLDLIKESLYFNNWRMPSLQQLKQEFHVEQELKKNKFFNSEEDYLRAMKNAQIVSHQIFKVLFKNITFQPMFIVHVKMSGCRWWPITSKRKFPHKLYPAVKL